MPVLYTYIYVYINNCVLRIKYQLSIQLSSNYVVVVFVETSEIKETMKATKSATMREEYYSSDDEMNYEEANDSDDDEMEDEEPQQRPATATSMATRSKRLKTSSRDVSASFRKSASSVNTIDAKPSKTNLSSIERMPTRRPNPKICNRNAVMARENRRKKKEYLENLQRDVDTFQTENKKLRKLLNIRNNMITKLSNESVYLKSVLANKTEIMALLKSIQHSRVPITSSSMSFVTTTDENKKLLTNAIKHESHDSYATSSSSGCSPASSFSPSPQYPDHTDKDNGTWMWMSDNDNDPMLSSVTTATMPYTESTNTNHLGFSFTDLSSHFSLHDGHHDELGWESLLMTNSSSNHDIAKCGDMRQQPAFCIADLRDIDDSEILSTNGSHNVNHEHNYFNNPVKPTKGMQPTMAVETAAQSKLSMSMVSLSSTASPSSSPSLSRSSSSSIDDADDDAFLMDMNLGASGASASPLPSGAPGVCLHVAGGRVSLEFCASCHLNSHNAWIEEL